MNINVSAAFMLAAGITALGVPATVFGAEGRGVATFAVAVTTVHDLKAVFATIESVDTVAARTRIGGTVAGLVVDEGARVEAGQSIARVEDPKLRPRRAVVEARIESIKSHRKLAALALDRVAKLRRSGTASQARLDEARTDLEVVDRNLAAMTAERDLVVAEQAEGAVVAPAAGRVLKVRVTEGAVVLPGETVALIAAEAYILRMRIPERHARFIGAGDEVLVGGRGLETPRRGMRKGRVRQLYPELEQGRVVADIDVAGLGDFFVGERIPVYVATGKRRVISVPPAFLSQRHGLTYARLDDGTEVVVQTGRTGDGGVEVLSGLLAGDVLARPEPAP